MDLVFTCNCDTEIEYSVPDDRASSFSVTCLVCSKVWKIINHVRPPVPMSRQERLSWCIIFVKQSLRDCGFWRFRRIRKLKADLLLYESGEFPD